MKGTIFRKLFVVYGLAIIIGFGILALLLLQQFNQYFIDSKKTVMLEQGSRISQEIAQSFYTGQIDRDRLMSDLEILDKLLSARIWLVDDGGLIVGVSGANEEKHLGQSVEEEQMAELAKGKAFFQTGYFGEKLETKSLTAGYPIFAGNVFEGGIFIHAPLTEIGRTFNEIYRITVAAILISCLIAYVILFFQIRKISRPLREISIASKEIAGGQFQKRLAIKTGDEIEELGSSFNHMAESLEKIEERRKNLIANISHDIRSPITSISGFAEGILDGTIPVEKQMVYLEKILSESRRLIKITSNLLDLNNMQEGRTIPVRSSFDINEMIRRAVLSFERQITEKALNVTLRFDSESIPVYTDPDMMERILVNLLDNAVKFTQERGNIAVSTSSGEERAIVEIRNDGAAFSDDQLLMLWERFHKGDASRGEDRNGFGLGLAIVRELAAILEERVWAEKSGEEISFFMTVNKQFGQQGQN